MKRVAMCLALISLAGIGCSSSKPSSTELFLSDYSKLKKSDRGMHYQSPKITEYDAFTIDHVDMSAAKKLDGREQAKVARYLIKTLSKELTKRGYRVVDEPGPGVARIRIAITGRSSMEGEIVDSQSGKQLVAVIQTGRGNQFERDSFSKLDDVKDAINRWVEMAGNRLELLRKSA